MERKLQSCSVDGGVKMQQKRILMARKPEDLKDVQKQTTGKITPAEIAEMVNKNEIKLRHSQGSYLFPAHPIVPQKDVYQFTF